MCDGQDEEFIVGCRIGDVVGVAANSNLTEHLSIDFGDGSPKTGPVEDGLDRIIDGSQQCEPETWSTMLIPAGRFPKLGFCLWLEPDPATQPASSSAIR